jgi:SAM-dependent methyltransferase
LSQTQPLNVSFIGAVPDIYESFLGPLIFTPFAQDLACRLQIGPRARLLELACGTGRLTRELVGVMEPGARLVATDLNVPMLAIAKQKVRDPRVEWLEADATSLPFEPESFDEVVSQFGVQFIEDKVAAAAQVRRVLKKGCPYHFSTWTGATDNPLGRIAQATAEACFPDDTPNFYRIPWSYHDTRQIESDLRAAGFKQVGIQDVTIIGRAPSSDYAAMGLVQGTPMAHVIAERGGISVDAFTALISAALSRELGTGPLAVPMRAWLVRAA